MGFFFFKVQKLQEAAEMVKSRCKNLLHENNLIIRNKNKRLAEVSVKRKHYSVSQVCIRLTRLCALSAVPQVRAWSGPCRVSVGVQHFLLKRLFVRMSFLLFMFEK